MGYNNLSVDHHGYTKHYSDRVGWLRAAVLGANDGIVSVASLVVGVATSGAPTTIVLMTGIAGTVAGAMSMAAGEYVSVQSQADTEAADLVIEQKALQDNPDSELKELAHIYEQRGLDHDLAYQVAVQLTAHNALQAHARDELGITEALRARPIQAALVSALAFCLGASMPVITAVLAPAANITLIITLVTIMALFVSGALAAKMGGASIWRGGVRVAIWGALAMMATAVVGYAFNVKV